MQFSHSTFCFPDTAQPIFRVDFDAATFKPEDLFWLPHHNRLSHAVNKRKAEHLAGRIAANQALKFHGIMDYIPGIGLHREPCWPPGFTGSITHSGNVALATVITDNPLQRTGLGIDFEEIITPQVAEDIYGGIIDCAEKELIGTSSFPFNYALTLVFSAKESLFKALFRHVGRYFDFSAVSITEIDGQLLTLTLNHSLGPYQKGDTFIAIWKGDARQLITLIRTG
ncbi:MAG TPA: enterobactin synthase subunit EntD [Buttiauxella sp.]